MAVLIAWGSLVAPAQTDTQEYFTNGLMNGRGWRSFSGDNKSMWIDGYHNGVLFGAAQLAANSPKCSTTEFAKSLNFKIKDTWKDSISFTKTRQTGESPWLVRLCFSQTK